MSMRWYVVHAYSGYEKKVALALKERIERHNMSDRFGEVLVHTEEVVEMRGGQKRRSERKFFPGYVLVQMELDDDTWHMVKDTPRVMGFIGGKADRPAPITEQKPMRFCSGLKTVWKHHAPRHCSSPARWCGLSMVPSTTLMALSRK